MKINNNILIVGAGLLAGLLVGGLLIHYRIFSARQPAERIRETSNALPGAEPPHVRGGDTAPVTLEEFGDFECPPCAAFHPELKKIEAEYGARLRVIFRHMPLDMGASRDTFILQSFGPATVFNNHILRSKLNYQFTRELFLRAILDYNAVLANPSLVSLERDKNFRADLLLTYLLNPGTALYLGYTDGYENIVLVPSLQPASQRGSGFPNTSTGRQFFVKVSYLLRY